MLMNIAVLMFSTTLVLGPCRDQCRKTTPLKGVTSNFTDLHQEARNS